MPGIVPTAKEYLAENVSDVLLGNPGLGDYEKAARVGNLNRMSKIRRLVGKGTHALYFFYKTEPGTALNIELT